MTDLPPETPCTCSEPGYCNRFQRDQSLYPWMVCQGTATGCDGPQSRKSLGYRTKWTKEVASSQEEKPLPSLLQRMGNATKAVVNTAKRALKRLPIFASKEEAEKRLAICQTNQCGFYRASDMHCSHKECGCLLGSKLTTVNKFGRPAKTALAGEKCPEGYWGPVKPSLDNPAQSLPQESTGLTE